MEVSPVSASLGAMGSLPRKLDELLATRHWALRGTVMDEIEQLTADLCILYKLMLKLSDAPQEHPMAARYWMKEVRELSYDMDDFADQFLHAHDHAKIRRAARRRIISRVKIKRLPERRKWRPWIIDKVSEFMTRAQEATRRYKFDGCASNPRYPRSGRELPTILPDPGDLVGIEGPKDKLERWLITGEEHLKVVSIVGVGGIGKTTLALKLWGKLHGQFECGAFVRTARKPDMRGILRNILLQVRPHQPPNHGEMRHLIDDLREYLQDKRYFLIIDDLWATSVWDVVSRAFPQSDCFSRIVTTTEIMEVALACCCFCPGHIFKMEPLSDIDSEKLLLQRILVSRNQSPQQFDDVIPQIMRSCGGLPLAIIIVARILASQPEKLEQWGSTQNSFDYIFGANTTMEGFMGTILNICFISLPHYLKTCLLHLSTYPEGYLFLKDDLVKQWVAEDFICANEGEDLKEVAGSYFDELVSMGLIQVMDINCDFESLSYSVHQLVLDLIAYKSIEENFITVVDYSQTTIPPADKVRRLSLHFGSATYATTPASTGLSQVRSLFFSGLFNCMPSFAVFKLLRVLILHLWDDTGTKTLNITGICELFWLRYLQVTCNVTVKLPDKIEAMKHLETLEINAQVLDIPLDIVRLSSLLHLCLRGANLPSGIGCIRSLRTLMHFDLGNSSEDNLCGLGELTNLQDLYLTYSSLRSSEHLKRNLIALASSLGKLCNLKSFTLVPGTAGMVVLFDGLSGMSTPIFLERLELLPPICIFSRLPKWTGQLRKICIMKVAVRELPTSDIAMLTGLPSLTVLSLSVQTVPEERIVFNDRAFPVLKCFKFRCGVLCMSFMAGAMPNLRGLKLCFNAHIGEEYDNMLVGIEHLLNLQDIVVQIGATTESDWRAAESAINYAINKHPRFLRLNLQWVDPVEEECRPSEKHHWSQEKSSLGGKHGVLEKANDMNKHADSGLSQLPNLPSTVASGRASGRLKSDSSVEESKESAAPALPWKLMERLLSKEEQEELTRRSQAMDKNDTSYLRNFSRQAYLLKLRDKKIDEIRDEILDHEYIFQDVKLTEAEEKDFRYKKKIYDLVKEHVESADDVAEYKRPKAYDMGEGVNQEKRFSVAMQRYKDPEAKDKMNPFAEQEAWEEHQIGKSQLQFGSKKDRKRSSDEFQEAEHIVLVHYRETSEKTPVDGNIPNDVPARENSLGLLKNLDDDNPCLLDIVSNEKIFNITDFSPEWACSTEHTKILVVGYYYEQYKHLAGSNIYGIFGDSCVVANMAQTGVYRFMVGPHTPGQVDFYLTLDGKTPISEVLSFEYRSMPGSSLQSELKPLEDEYTKSKLRMQLRLARLLFVTNKKKIAPKLLVEGSKVSNLILASPEKEWMDLWKIAGDSEGTPVPATEDLLELVLRNRVQEWLLERVTGGHKSTGRDDLGQGPIHLCSFLGYTWAIRLFSVSGFSLDFRDSSGWTALHWAAYHGREKMVAALLSAGANPSLVTDPTVESPGGCTPADLAARQGYVGLAKYLAEKGLTAHFESMSLSKDTERSPSRTNLAVHSEKFENLTEQELCLKESLAAYRNAVDAASNIQAAFRDRTLKLQEKAIHLANPEIQATAIVAAMRIQHAFRNYNRKKEIRAAAAARIQNHFRTWKVRKNFTNMRRQAIRIQAAYRGHQVRRQNRKVIWSVGVVEKAILRWRKKRKTAEEDFIQASRQRAEDRLNRSVAHVEALFRGYRAQHEYRRMRIAHEEAMLELSNEQQRGPACRSHVLNIYMSASRHDLNVQYM